MYCPRCATENTSQQRYCRQCGLALLGVHLSLEGRTDEAIAKLKKGTNTLSGALLALVIFIPIVVVALLSKGKLDILNFALSMAIVFAVILPFVVTSMVRFWRAERLLNLSDDPRNPVITVAKDTEALPSRDPIVNRLISQKEPVHISATEGTTLNLEPPIEKMAEVFSI